MRMVTRWGGGAVALVGLVACGSVQSSGVDAGPDASSGVPIDGNVLSGDGSSGPVTIQQVQNNSMPVGTAVNLSSVIVTAVDTLGPKTGNFWVEESTGGPFSGVLVFGAPGDQVAGLAVGDVINLSGAVKSEFATTTDTSGRSVTELVAPIGGMISIVKLGAGSVPLSTIDAFAISQMTPAMAEAEHEKWEGVLIRVLSVTEAAAPVVEGGDLAFSITGDFQVRASQAAFPPDLAANACLASVTGIEDYFLNYELLPRQTSEIVTGGSGCH